VEFETAKEAQEAVEVLIRFFIVYFIR